MSARIIELSDYAARRAASRIGNGSANAAATSPIVSTLRRLNGTRGFHFWTGASGRAYVHSVFTLLDCPPLPACCYALVRRHPDGRTEAVAFGVLEHHAPTLNLAEVRHRAARLGASEVHVHLLSTGRTNREDALADLLASGGRTAATDVSALRG